MIERFNALPEHEARRGLCECLASKRWVDEVVSGRPYRDVDDLLRAGDVIMGRLSDGEWLEAMRAHPRIGEGGGDAPASSAREQSRAMQAPASTLATLAAENRQYEQRFGHVFLIFARGRGGGEILAELRRRMKNDPARELDEAKEQLRKIAELRLGKMLER